MISVTEDGLTTETSLKIKILLWNWHIFQPMRCITTSHLFDLIYSLKYNLQLRPIGIIEIFLEQLEM